MWKAIDLSDLAYIEQESGAAEPNSGFDNAAIAKRLMVDENALFHFSSKRRTIGDVTVALTSTSPISYSGLSSAESDDLHVGFLLHGELRLGSKTKGVETYSSTRPFILAGRDRTAVECLQASRSIEIEVSAARLRERGIMVTDGAARFSSSMSLIAPLRLFALSLIDSVWSPSATGAAVTGRALEDLVVGLLLEAEGYAMDSFDLRAGLRARANAVISAGHLAPQLDSATVARSLNVSLRHLQRAFEETGMSLSHQIGNRRAESAATLLTASRDSHLTITDIAARSGFTSPFELRGAFRARFGMLPSRYAASIDHESATDQLHLRATSS